MPNVLHLLDDLPATPMGERTVPAMLENGRRRWPDKVAIRDVDSALTYRGLYDATYRLAGGMKRLGTERQERVIVMLDNHVDHVITWFGLGCFAAVEVPIHTAFVGAMLSYVINDSEASTIVIEDQYCPRLADISEELQHLDTVVVRGGDGASLDPERFDVRRFSELTDGDGAEPELVHPWDLGAILYTSGTTGPSKGVMVTQAQTYMRLPPEQLGIAEHDDVHLVTLPLFHVVAQSLGVCNALIAGATAVILDGFHVSTFWDDVRRFGATLTTLLGAMGNFLYRQPPRDDDADNPLRGVILVPVIPEYEDFKQRFAVEISTSYGMTEVTSPMVVPLGGPVTPRGCGWLRPDYDALIVDEHDIEVEQGTVGELLLRARDPWSIMVGYWNKPEATSEAWRNLWFHTGDLFYRDPDGQYFFVDRHKDAIRRRGENVSTYEVEAEINRHDAVIESAVFGVDSVDSEQEIAAVVAIRAGSALAEVDLLRHLAGRLPYFMVPRYVRLVDDLPKTVTQKIDKVQLAATGIDDAWDREAHGIAVTRTGFEEAARA